jgi:hypothetical protein
MFFGFRQEARGFFVCLLNFMLWTHSRSVDCFLASQAVFPILSNQKIYYSVHKTPLDAHQHNNFEPGSYSNIIFRKPTLILCSHLRFIFPRDLFPYCFLTKILRAASYSRLTSWFLHPSNLGHTCDPLFKSWCAWKTQWKWSAATWSGGVLCCLHGKREESKGDPVKQKLLEVLVVQISEGLCTGHFAYRRFCLSYSRSVMISLSL